MEAVADEAVRKVLDLLGSLIRALKDLKTTIFVAAFLVFGKSIGFLHGLEDGQHITCNCNAVSYNSYNVSKWQTNRTPRTYEAGLSKLTKTASVIIRLFSVCIR